MPTILQLDSNIPVHVAKAACYTLAFVTFILGWQHMTSPVTVRLALLCAIMTLLYFLALDALHRSISTGSSLEAHEEPAKASSSRLQGHSASLKRTTCQQGNKQSSQRHSHRVSRQVGHSFRINCCRHTVSNRPASSAAARAVCDILLVDSVVKESSPCHRICSAQI